MIVGAAGGDASNPAHLQIVDDYFEKLITQYDVYLFSVFSAGIKGIERTHPTLAQQYAKLRGLPCSHKEFDTFDELVQGYCKYVDYLIILNDNTQYTKRLFMTYKQTDKHGSMIRL